MGKNNSKWGKLSEALLETFMPLYILSLFRQEIIETFGLARILDNIKPNTLIWNVSTNV